MTAPNSRNRRRRRMVGAAVAVIAAAAVLLVDGVAYYRAGNEQPAVFAPAQPHATPPARHAAGVR